MLLSWVGKFLNFCFILFYLSPRSNYRSLDYSGKKAQTTAITKIEWMFPGGEWEGCCFTVMLRSTRFSKGEISISTATCGKRREKDRSPHPHTINRTIEVQTAGGFFVSLGLYFLTFGVKVENVLLSKIWNSTLVWLTGQIMELALSWATSQSHN